ncbi:hypothetical protein PybrP1_008881 [[Pythium] brassicae (nom. inval.)]|nr:hypothetical protein PybrP1_008881 [[Pythium] brassicae (nom. inval.)]
MMTRQQQPEDDSHDQVPVGPYVDVDNEKEKELEEKETVEDQTEAHALDNSEEQAVDDQEMDFVGQPTDIVDQAMEIVDQTTDIDDQAMDDAQHNKETDVDPEEQKRIQEQRQRELDKLRAIDAKVRQVHERLSSRLPRQRAHLAAKVCGTVWAVKAQHVTRHEHDNADSLTKKLRLELGAFDYQVREQGELLTRHLCDLDDVLSFGDAAIKDARKALVVFIQSEALPLADALRAQSDKLRAFGERLIATVSVAASAESSSMEAQASSTVEPSSNEAIDDGDDDEEMVDDNDDNDEREEDRVDNGSDSGVDNDDDNSNVNDDNDSDDDGDKDDDDGANDNQSHDSCDPRELAALPVWKPYYQIQQRRDALYLIANLHDVKPQDVRVQWLERSGVLHISGVKLPTRRDVMVSRFSGVPTFGRFEIAERVPASVGVDMARASQTLDKDGTLEVRMPYATPIRSAVGGGDEMGGMRFVRPRNDISMSNRNSSEHPHFYSYEHSQQPYHHHHQNQQQQQQSPRQSYYYQHPHHQELHHPLYPLQQYYQPQQGYPRSAFRRRASPWFDAPRCMVW